MCIFSIKEIVDKATVGINLVNKNFSFPSGSRLGVFYEGESILKKDANYFNSLKIK